MTKHRMYLILEISFYTILAILLFNSSVANSLDVAKKTEEFIIAKKADEKARDEALIDYFYRNGKRLLEEENYQSAADQFSYMLEIDPEHKGAKRELKTIRKKLEEKRQEMSPQVAAERLLKSGRFKYVDKDYEGAIEDFQNALILDDANKDVMDWLKRARRRLKLKKAKTKESELLKDIKIAEQEKAAHERTAMLEVDKAYLPPEKPEREPVEIEEIISPEEEREAKAKKELLEKLQKKMVPAISLTDADIRDVIREFMEVTGVTIVIDEGALAEAVGKEPLRLTLSTVTPLPLLEILNIALRATELGYAIEPNYIWISSLEKLKEEKLVTKTYKLRYGVRRIRKVELREYTSDNGTIGGD